ncbi:NAD-dependent epimerase/dehydratase family protein [Falsiroseomonas sp. HC035]|uniref:NAD-dependent epimerase/dehydratase family protein n=1 Tax=Falsiroseomonas sp. HC035 TaxID=3390999 RepID=UPI003D3154BF
MTAALPPDYRTLAGQRCLVTGAAGFIGGALLRRLAGYGLDVTGSVLHQAEAEVLRRQGFQTQVLDLASNADWDATLRGIDVVFNVAAMFQETDQPEAMYDRVNHLGALRLAETALRLGTHRFIQCSTVGVHGHVREIPARETTPFNPMDLYHRTKLAGELALMELARRTDPASMAITAIRPAMVYGPGDMRMLKLFRTILAGRFVMIGSGRVWTHLGHVEDNVDAMLLAAVAPAASVHGEAFNIASDEPMQLAPLVELIAREGGVKPPQLRVPVAPVWTAGLAVELLCRPFGWRPPLSRRRVGFFTHDRAFDLSKARHLLGYRSRWPHAEGVRDTIAAYRAQGLVAAAPAPAQYRPATSG